MGLEEKRQMGKTTQTTTASGHRQRLRERFLAGESAARTDAALLELLLTYAIPQQDVQPLASALLARFGDLPGVLTVEPSQLCKIPGIKTNSALLLTLVDTIRTAYPASCVGEPRAGYFPEGQLPLFDTLESVSKSRGTRPSAQMKSSTKRVPPPLRQRSELFANAALREAIELLPHAPLTESLDTMKQFLRANLRFSSEQTRKRNADYITQRMFAGKAPDRALLTFARQYAGRQELRDVCFYRFCVAEPLLFALTNDLLLPAIGAGYVERARLRDYLTQRNPASKSIRDAVRAVSSAYAAGHIGHADDTGLTFAYRDILLPSFAFVLHSEFPEPGMYDIAKLEGNRAVRALLWNPERLVPMLYELRNRGILSKVSQIDSVRQFTTNKTLDEVVNVLAGAGARA